MENNPIEFTVAPRRPELQINTEPRRDAYEIDQPFQATCISRDGRPPARIQWFLDDEELTEGLSLPRVLESLTDRNTTLYTVVQTLTRHLKATDDRKVLYCRTSHPAEPGATQENKFQIQVRCECVRMAFNSLFQRVCKSFRELINFDFFSLEFIHFRLQSNRNHCKKSEYTV